MEKHAAGVSSLGFYTLRQLRRVRQSLDTDAIKTLVHAFVTTRVDYCNGAFAGSPDYVTDRLQHVLDAAARLVSGTRKCDRGRSSLLHDDLHWLDVPQRIQFKLDVTVRRCLQNTAPVHLMDCCSRVADTVGMCGLYYKKKMKSLK